MSSDHASPLTDDQLAPLLRALTGRMREDSSHSIYTALDVLDADFHMHLAITHCRQIAEAVLRHVIGEQVHTRVSPLVQLDLWHRERRSAVTGITGGKYAGRNALHDACQDAADALEEAATAPQVKR